MIQISDLVAGYSSLSWKDRLHMLIRWRICPMTEIAAQVPDRGVIVDLGCGHGLFAQLLAREYPTRSVIGVDLDAHKIAIAQQLKMPNLRFMVGDVAEVNLPLVNTITILDVFYLIPYDVQEKLLRVCAEKLEAGGTIILKDMAEVPRWKFYLNWLEETLAVKVLRITLGDKFYFRTRTEWQKLLKDLGFVVKVIPLDVGYYHPHIMFVARKSAA